MRDASYFVDHVCSFTAIDPINKTLRITHYALRKELLLSTDTVATAAAVQVRPARKARLSRMARQEEIAGWLIANGWASSITVASPSASRARMALRVGSASAAKVAFKFNSILVI